MNEQAAALLVPGNKLSTGYYVDHVDRMPPNASNRCLVCVWITPNPTAAKPRVHPLWLAADEKVSLAESRQVD